MLARQRLGDGALGDPQEKPIQISGKVVEEVGFDKIRKQLAELQELKIVLLDGLRVAGVLAQEASLEQYDAALQEIQQTCPKIMELDLSRNLINRWKEVSCICSRLKRLRKLKLNGNRFCSVEESLKFEGITELHLDDTLLSWDEISSVAGQFPSLTTLSASANQLSALTTPIANTITTLSLEHNTICSLSSVEILTSLTNLKHLSLRGNIIDKVYEPEPAEKPLRFSPSLKSIDLSRNNIHSWVFVNELSDAIPNLETLRISGNPLFNQPVGPSVVTGMPEKPMTVDEAYMLTLARLASLQVLNYGKITPKDRTNGELYYLSLIGKELSASPETAEHEILSAHPRYKALCEIHGAPVISRASTAMGSGTAVNPRSVAARLVKMVFRMRCDGDGAETVKVVEVPRSFDVYQVKAIVARVFSLTPLSFRLIWETDELDPVSRENMEADEGWDSEDEGGQALAAADSDPGFVRREVELIDTTKDIGFWFQSDLVEARVRVESLPC
ncbi:conserved hypothetical protein [Aspergillus terreus NIH2624]|uniref:Tubulin-specific chaperone E n=1 Tax=Aspergillus terreus (strain NIH 2624 / FGSC A1156) TaxID=341663 RepID=Q0CR06_ASPTN|nr:uncharacterized protein ATEG_03878 [Aspergillus terreus NIH2624]EAU35680.1 conserved hypothetical protein [Aspergillus terreus NIH2624]